MKRLIIVILMLIIFPPMVAADDADNLKRSVQALHDALNNGDADKVVKYFLPDARQFPRTGKCLMPFFTNTQQLKSLFDAGLKYQVKIRNLDAKAYGDSAVTTCYTSGVTSYPDGTVLEGTFRVSVMWIRHANQWKIAHGHISRLLSTMQ
jgi:ketosteroid isomerase-like protein